MRVLPSGERAVLVEVEDARAAQGLASRLREMASEVVEEIVPAARTVLLVARDAGRLAELRALAASVSHADEEVVVAAELTLVVDYDGDDLADVAQLSGLSVAEVIRRHSAAVYTVEFVGFAPGFGYLTGLDPALQLPRLESPRPSVPSGSVAIAGPYTAVYPRASPGGWRLLGRTATVLFDPEAQPPSALVAGTVVRFVPR